MRMIDRRLATALLAALVCMGLAGAAEAIDLLSPTGTVSTVSPVFNWTADVSADWYQVNVKQGGSTVRSGWSSGTEWISPVPLADGVYTWGLRTWSQAQGLGQWSADQAFEVVVSPAVPQAIEPAHESQVPTNRPTFSWGAAERATWYQLWIAKDGAKYHDVWLQETTWTPSTKMPRGTYRWWIRALNQHGQNWSTGYTFEVPHFGPGQPTLHYPISGRIEENQPGFTWSSVAGATHYRVMLYRDGAPYMDEWVENATAWTPPATLSGGSYDWWVLPWGPSGVGLWSQKASFRIGVGQPTLVSPSGSITDRTPLLRWSTVTGATWYRVMVARGSATVYDNWVQGTSVTLPQQAYGSYLWWVHPWGPTGAGVWSSSGSFWITDPGSGPYAERDAWGAVRIKNMWSNGSSHKVGGVPGAIGWTTTVTTSALPGEEHTLVFSNARVTGTQWSPYVHYFDVVIDGKYSIHFDD